MATTSDTVEAPDFAMSPRVFLADAVAAESARRDADIAVLVSCLRWANAHPGHDADQASWSERDLHGEGGTPIAGPGAPLTAEFAVAELSAAMGWTYEKALAWTGAAVELHHRLPRLWKLVMAGTVPVWLARAAAEQSTDLSIEAADHADRMLVWQARRLNPTRVARLVQEARLYADPDRARADEDEALARRRVELFEGQAPATTDIRMTVDTADAVAFECSLSNVASSLAALGDLDTLDVRRARAVGVLADPQHALDLTAAAHPGTDPAEAAGLLARQSTGQMPATIYLHVDATDLIHSTNSCGSRSTGDLVVRTERLGPVLDSRIKEWLTGSKVIIRPVLDLGRTDAVDAHDPPAWMRELVVLRDPTCVFPGCRRSARRADMDHIDPYVPTEEGGPPGQTSPEALAPLCRRHHRAKTHADFSYQRLADGSYRWTLPTGHVVDTDPGIPRPRAPERRT